MFDKFKYEAIPLASIGLDFRNPRLVTLTPLKSETEIADYMFAHENLSELLEKIVMTGRNVGAERPYVVKSGNDYIVIEGNRRIATYKILTGLLKPSKEFLGKIPAVSDAVKAKLATIECSVAPSRDDLLPIMANAHFGLGDKAKWGYLGSRKAVYDEYKAGRSVASLASAFDRRKGQIRDYILEYALYLKALSFDWTTEERESLEDPSVEFNPPVRFLQAQGHKDKVGVEFDRDALEVKIAGDVSGEKLRHLVKKLVVSPQKGLGATASYDAVFADFKPGKPKPDASKDGSDEDEDEDEDGDGGKKKASPNLKAGALFNYPVSQTSLLIKQLAKEARNLNCHVYPAAGTFLLRNLLEALLKTIIDEKKANPKGDTIGLETALKLANSPPVGLSQADKQVLNEFRKSHLGYVNLGAHGNVIPNSMRLFSARDCVDQFVKRHI